MGLHFWRHKLVRDSRLYFGGINITEIRNFSSGNLWPGSIFHVTLIIIIIPSWVLLNVRHLIIRHSLKNVFNSKFVMLPCLNDINKKRNFRVRNHHNKDLVQTGGGQNNITHQNNITCMI